MTSTGEGVVTTLRSASPGAVVQGRPVRRFGWYPGMRHYPGWLWSATMGDLVGYESLLERDRLLLADFDCDVEAVASQPFGLSGRDGDVRRAHVPDYLLCRRDGSVVVVDVKPALLVDEPEVAAVLAWTGRLMAERGWRYEVWSGADPVRLANVRFLRQGRRWDSVDEAAVGSLLVVATTGMTLEAAIVAAGASGRLEHRMLRAALLALLWHQVWVVDLDVPLSGSTVIEEIRQEADDRRSA